MKTEKQAAEMMTKHLPREKLENSKSLIGKRTQTVLSLISLIFTPTEAVLHSIPSIIWQVKNEPVILEL
jgi:hypothetical protein